MTLLNPDGTFGLIKDTRAKVAALREALLAPTPDALLESVPGLSHAVESMAAVERAVREQPAVSIDVIRELKSLKSDLRAAQKLIEHGAEFHRGWARLLGAASSGYTASGDAAPLNTRRTIAVEG